MKNKTPKLGVYALHPIMYQTPIFSCLHSRSKSVNFEAKVLYGDDISLREVYYEETKVTFKPDTPFLLDGYEYKFLKNYASDARGGFFSRANYGIIFEIFKGRYDALLIHGFDRFTSFLAIFAAKLSGTKLIWRGENIVKEKHQKVGLKGRIKYFLIKLLFKQFHAVLYSCTGNHRYLKFYGVPDEKLFSIPCAVNNEFFQQERNKLLNDRDSIREQIGINKNDIVIIFPARFTERKRPYDLIDAVSDIKNTNIKILFVGDGPERDKMESYADERNVETIFTGFMNQSQISKYYIAADIGAVVSREDPSPKAMNEMMNFDLPIIVTDVVGTALDLVKDGINGFVVGVGDVAKTSEKLKVLVDDSQLRKKMGYASTDIVSSWNYEADVNGILEGFEFVTGKRLKDA